MVIGLDHESFRVLNDNEEPILYPKELFEVIDPDIPTNWIWERYSDEEYYVNPPSYMSQGFMRTGLMANQ
jgi:hypothetical protein